MEQYIRTLGIPNTTFVYLGCYYQNFHGLTRPNENGELEVIIPYLEENDTIPYVDPEGDTGVSFNIYIWLFRN